MYLFNYQAELIARNNYDQEMNTWKLFNNVVCCSLVNNSWCKHQIGFVKWASEDYNFTASLFYLFITYIETRCKNTVQANLTLTQPVSKIDTST